MKIAYFDCFSGAAGDMILAALIDAGWPLAELESLVARLKLPDVSVRAQRVKRHGIGATHVQLDIVHAEKHGHRHLPQILRILDAADLPARVRHQAAAVFRRLAEAEAKVHQTTVEKVHFHEVGAADAIVDIVGACAGLAWLGAARITCSPLPPGNGTVECEHGVMPVPAPATAELLRGFPVVACEEMGELVTPTGAAILTTLCDGFESLPEMRVERVGYGAGTREGKTRPNFLRLWVGDEATSLATADTVVVLEAQVDDMSGQGLAFAMERILEAGALDAYLTPILMKKGRPGNLLTTLVRPDQSDTIERSLLRHTSTLGVRRRITQRRRLEREIQSVQTAFGAVRVKVAGAGNERRAWPEYDDCAAAAAREGVSIETVQHAALRAWEAAPSRTQE